MLPVTAVAMVLLVLMGVLPRLAKLLGTHTWAEALAAQAGLAEASLTLYADPVLFQPWQLWSWTLVDAALGMWLANALLIAALLTALERRLGSLWPALLLVALAPVGAVVHLVAISAHQPVQVGAGALVAGLAGCVWGLFRPARLAIGIGWWAVVVAGWLPLGAVALPVLGLAWAVLDGLVHGLVAGIAGALTLGTGMGLGITLRRRLRWRT